MFLLDDELEEVVDYCRDYLDCKLQDYRRVWYTLHTIHDAAKWSNILVVSELLFSLPFTNSKVERSFSNLKVIKSERRTSLHTSTLDDLLEINIEGPQFEDFNADHAVELWWADSVRRPNQKPRKDYRSRDSSTHNDTASTSDKPTEEYSLDDWDQWFDNQ